MSDDTNALIDPPADVAEPEIDAAYVAEWWRGIDLGPAPEEDDFHQALRLTISSRRAQVEMGARDNPTT